jgi:predicted GNAT family N-acyltransferase
MALFHLSVYSGLGPVLDQCWALRRAVFIEEQAVPVDEEVDGLDGDCTHLLLRELEGPPLACARMRSLPDGGVKAERVAVAASARGRGHGRTIMAEIARLAREDGAPEVILAAQVSAIPFYLALGYAICSEEFMDAGIPHRKMRLPLGPAGVRKTP